MELRIEVNNADIREARRLWEGAAEGDASAERVAMLKTDYVRLISAQAQQIADDFRAQRRVS